uniref:(northern house mosquito) hypothetical protein n=1 Tax=Culex pipiens TaxID=7175 RepID=A0A8D8BXY0_CULPI
MVFLPILFCRTTISLRPTVRLRNLFHTSKPHHTQTVRDDDGTITQYYRDAKDRRRRRRRRASCCRGALYCSLVWPDLNRKIDQLFRAKYWRFCDRWTRILFHTGSLLVPTPADGNFTSR